MKEHKKFDPCDINIRELAIYITDRCDKKCLHCFIPKKNNDINPRWIQKILDFFPNISKCVLVGGEPTLSPVLMDTIKILKEAKVNITMSTNCQWIRNKDTREETLKKIEGVDSIQISIEGSAKTTNRIRGKGTYNDCMKAVDLLKKKGFDVFFRATYSNTNFHEIPKMLKLASEKDVHLILFPYMGRDAVPLSMDQQETLYNTLMDYTEIDEKNGINRMALSNIPQYFTYIGQHGYCPAGRELLNILPNGMITPCEMNMPPDHFLLGRFNGNDLDREKLKGRIKIFLEYHKPIYQECMSCKHHRICRSGCHETKENMNCPLQYNIDFEKYFDVYNTNKHQVISKTKHMKHIMNKRKGC